MGSVGSVTEIFWQVAPPPSEAETPQEVVRYAMLCLEAFEERRVTNPKTGKPIDLMELLADVGIEEDLVYASPELARGESFDERSLVFTLGVLIFERLTGRHPFGTDTNKRLARIRRGEMGSGVNYFPAVPSDLRVILMRAMGPFPEERYRSLQEMKEDLRKFGGVGGSAKPGFFDAPTQVSPPPPMQEPLARQASSPEWMEPEEEEQLAPPKNLFDDIAEEDPSNMGDSHQRPLELSPGSTIPPALAVSTVRRSEPPSGSGLLKLMPLVYGLAGAAVASLLFVIFGSRQPAPTAGAHPEVQKPEVQKKVHEQPSSKRRMPKIPGDRVKAPRAPVRRRAPADPGQAAGLLVGGVVRSCQAEGTFRVAVYLRPEGKVVRAFISRTGGASRALVKCVRKQLPGTMLPIQLPKADFVEWRLRIKPEGVEVKLIRPKRLR